MVPFSLPPGPRYVIKQLPNLIVPPFVVYVLSRISREHLNIALPTWLLVLAYVFSWPLALVALIQWNDFSNARRARSWGAVIPREVDHKYPGSVDLLQQMFVLDKTRYLCGYSASFNYFTAFVPLEWHPLHASRDVRLCSFPSLHHERPENVYHGCLETRPSVRVGI